MLQDRREAVKIHRLAVAFLRGGEQPAGGLLIEIKSLLQQQQQGAAFGRIEKSVDFGDMDEKRRGGEAQVAFAELAFGGIGTSHFLKKLPQLVEHAIH